MLGPQVQTLRAGLPIERIQAAATGHPHPDQVRILTQFKQDAIGAPALMLPFEPQTGLLDGQGKLGQDPVGLAPAFPFSQSGQALAAAAPLPLAHTLVGDPQFVCNLTQAAPIAFAQIDLLAFVEGNCPLSHLAISFFPAAKW